MKNAAEPWEWARRRVRRRRRGDGEPAFWQTIGNDGTQSQVRRGGKGRATLDRLHANRGKPWDAKPEAKGPLGLFGRFYVRSAAGFFASEQCKERKKLSKILSVVLSLTLCAGLVAPSFAAATFADLQGVIDNKQSLYKKDDEGNDIMLSSLSP